MPESDDYLYQLFRKLHFSRFAARTAQFLLERPLVVLLVLVGAVVVARLGSRLARRSIESLVARSSGHSLVPDDGGRTSKPRATARARTLAGVAASLVHIVVFTIAALIVLEQIGINLGPFLAGASIVGVALGFGAQSLVRDFLSGFFILAEDQFGVGDVVTVSDVNGTVEEVNLRVTRLRGVDGTVWFVPNGEIRTVGNSAKDWARAIVDVVVPSGTDLNLATAAIGRELADLPKDADWVASVLEPPEVLGVEAAGPDGFTVRVAARTDPAARARVTRELRARITGRLQEEGVVPVREPGSPTGSPEPGAGS